MTRDFCQIMTDLEYVNRNGFHTLKSFLAPSSSIIFFVKNFRLSQLL